MKRVIRPTFIWIAFDPNGVARDAFIEEPRDEALAWLWMSDQDGDTRRSHIVMPMHGDTAKKAGYRLRRFRTSSGR